VKSPKKKQRSDHPAIEQPMPNDKRFINLVGRTFNRLTVEFYCGKKGHIARECPDN
jgi:hypothetical protein